MKTSDFAYDLPDEYIAQTPVEPRDHSRLLVYHRQDGRIEHRHFYDIHEYLSPGDALVINETKVLPARLLGARESTGGAVEILLLKRLDINTWEALVKPGKKLRVGSRAVFGDAGQLVAEIIETTPEGGRILRFHYEGVFEELLERLGQMPLPPYIREKLDDQERYQTVYAKSTGSAAAPTAGLHFTPELLEKLRAKGVDIAPVLLHVGLGTFRPVKVEDVQSHSMHSEYWEVSESTAHRVNAAHDRSGRVFCVGTTSVRTLETASDAEGILHAGAGDTDIFIYPGYKFRCVDALITNFHLPESTLLMLVGALIGREEVLRVYRIAVEQKYRFFSFGDAMLIV